MGCVMFKKTIAIVLSMAEAMPLPAFLTKKKDHIFIDSEPFEAPKRNRKEVVLASDKAKRKKKRKAQRVARRNNRK